MSRPIPSSRSRFLSSTDTPWIFSRSNAAAPGTDSIPCRSIFPCGCGESNRGRQKSAAELARKEVGFSARDSERADCFNLGQGRNMAEEKKPTGTNRREFLATSAGMVVGGLLGKSPAAAILREPLNPTRRFFSSAPSAPRRIILDTDPGIDDAMAILLTLRSPEIKIEAITPVSGNVPLELTLPNALRLVEIAGTHRHSRRSGRERAARPQSHHRDLRARRKWPRRRGLSGAVDQAGERNRHRNYPPHRSEQSRRDFHRGHRPAHERGHCLARRSRARRHDSGDRVDGRLALRRQRDAGRGI